MKAVSWMLATLLLVACAQAPQPFHQTTFSTGTEQNATATINAARAWLLTHGFGLVKRDGDDFVYALKEDQNIIVTVRRKPDYPMLVALTVSERDGSALRPGTDAIYAELSESTRLFVQRLPKAP